MKRSAAVLALILPALAGCGSSSASGSPGATGAGSSSSGSSGGSAPGGSSGGSSSGGGSGSGGGVSGAGDASAGDGDSDGAITSSSFCDGGGCASLVGLVERTSTQPSHGGKGSVYVAVFEGDPVTDSAGAVVVARTLLTNVDMSAATAQIAYRVDGVPVSATAYQVIAFLDDADAVSASSPAPAAGDLISLQLTGGISGIPVTLTQAGDTTLDLALNAQMP